MLVVTAPDIAKLHQALGDMSTRALPHAARQALTTSAKATSHEWEVTGKKTMIVRNKWTFGGRNHQVKKARTKKKIRDMEAIAGNKHKYMQEQERGVFRFALWRHGAPVPTLRSRTGASKRRLMQRPFWRRNMKLGKRFRLSDDAFASKRGGQSRKKRYIAASIQQAKKQGMGFVYLDFGAGNRGIYDVRLQTKMKRVWNLNRRVRYTKPNPMLRRTLKKLQPHFVNWHATALKDQIRFVLGKRGLRPSGVQSFISKLA